MLFPASVSCFLEAARQRNITRAAENLYMSRQAVSKQIIRLEDELGVRLFDRGATQLSLTAAGQMYYSFFCSVLDKWKALQADVHAISTQNRLIRIGFPKGINIEEQIFSLVDSCAKGENGLRFIWERLEPAELTEGLLLGSLDIIFSFEPELHDADIDREVFIESQFCLVISEAHPDFSAIKTLKDFEKCTFLTWKLEHLTQDASADDFSELCAKCGIRVRYAARLPNMESVVTAVEMGSGVTICSIHDSLCSRPRVRVFPLELKSNIEVAWRKDEANPDTVGFVSKIKEKLNITGQ